MLSIAICDDEEYFRITEKQLILKYMAGKNCECMIDMYESGKELLALKSAISQYHIIFLDVNMDTILEKMDYEENEMTFDFQEGKTTISLENLIYVESNLHRLVFYMAGEDAVHYTIYTKLDDVAELLQNKGFCRIHKSYLVNLKYVKSVERYRAVLSNGKSLAISKARFLDTRNEFACYRGEI